MRLLRQPGQRSGDVDRQARTPKARGSWAEPGDLAQPAPGLPGEAHGERRETGPPAPERNAGRQFVARSPYGVLRPQRRFQRSGRVHSPGEQTRSSLLRLLWTSRAAAWRFPALPAHRLRDEGYLLFRVVLERIGPSGARPPPTRSRNIGNIADRTGSSQWKLEVLGYVEEQKTRSGFTIRARLSGRKPNQGPAGSAFAQQAISRSGGRDRGPTGKRETTWESSRKKSMSAITATRRSAMPTSS